MSGGRAGRIFWSNLGRDNPVFVQILGICSTLAVTNSLRNTAVMCAGLLFTVVCSNVSISALRRWIPGRVRMMVEVLVIAGYVILVDVFLKAYAPDIWRQLGPYVGLIITNCIIMGRAEAFAMNHPPGLAFVDGLGAGLGYSYVLLLMAVVRETLGYGTLWGVPVLGAGWVNWTVLAMAPGGFFVLALLIWCIRGFSFSRGPRGRGVAS